MSNEPNKPGLSRRLLGFFETAVTEFYAGGLTPQPDTALAKLGTHLSERPFARLAFNSALGIGGLVAISALTGPLTLGHVAGTWIISAVARRAYARLNRIAPGLDDQGKPFVDADHRDAVVAARRQALVEKTSMLSAMAGSSNARNSKVFLAALNDAMWQGTKLAYTPSGVEGEKGFWRRPAMRLVQNIAVPLIATHFLGLSGTLGVLAIDHVRRRIGTETNAALQKKYGGQGLPAENDNPLLPPKPTRLAKIA